MTILTIQLDVRLRALTPDGLSDVTGTFTHYDLPLDAAGNDWTGEELDRIHERALAHLTSILPDAVMGLLAHCQWEQPELPFG